MRISAEQFSREGDKYLGRSYDDMDCQEFVERCMKDAGLTMDLKGSNAWYREVMENGWVGTPEQCKETFGSVPKGALIFIREYDGGEVKRGYLDGLGNASHIGIKTGRGKGAIHSSHSRGGVVESDFRDRTVRNGGWNLVGLYNKFTYGETIDRMLDGFSGGGIPDIKPSEHQEDENMYDAILEGGNPDAPINIRKKPEGDLLEKIPQGSRVTVLAESGNWCKVRFVKNGRAFTGYVLGDFVTVADDEPISDIGIPAEDFGDDPGEDEKVTLTLTAAEAAVVLPVLEKLVDSIVNQAGRG